MTKNYRVNFNKVEREVDKKTNELLGKTYVYVGSVNIDDSNVDGTNLTLVSKAYRHAPHFSHCDHVEIFEVK